MDRSTAAEPSRHDELESTPFLASDPLGDETTAAEFGEGPQTSQPKTALPPKWSLVASAVSLALAIITLAFNTAAAVMPRYYYYSQIEFSIDAVRVVAIVAIILAVINIIRLNIMKRPLPPLLTIIVHVAVVIFTLKAAVDVLDYLVNRYYVSFGLKIVLWNHVAFTTLLGLHHAFMLVLDGVSMYSSRSRRLSSYLTGWGFPAGELSVHLSVKLQRPESRADNSTTGGQLSGDLV